MKLPQLLAVLALAAGLGLAGAGRAARVRAEPAAPPASPAGEALFLHGVLRSGAALVANRADAEPMSGEQAACVNCHQRSGLGTKEARIVIPPITARFLFGPRSNGVDDLHLPYIPGARLDRSPYTEQTLARALREGVDADGRQLSYLMPRFDLTDEDIHALVAHLRTLDAVRVPGVSSAELHFATIITPDADPVRRKAVLDVLQHFFEERERSVRGETAQTMTTSGRTSFAKRMFKVNRRWVLHVWELTGPASGWTDQLRQKFAAEPVFAVLSGVGGHDWSPVATFCEQQPVPCLFPNIDQPPADGDHQFHSLYFSRGVLLEADLIAAAAAPADASPARIHQVYRLGDVGEAAAKAAASQWQARGVAVTHRAIAAKAPPAAVAAALREIGDSAPVVLWLRPADLAALEKVAPPAGPLYISGLMAGLDAAPLPVAWRSRAHLAYPVDLPERRRVRVDYALGWFRIRQIPVIAEQAQADTYLACGLVSETLKHMVDAFIPDYLIESLQETVEHRIVTGYYPHLTLGPNQRFASKGGYLLHFDPSGAGKWLPDGDWTTP
jgi:hypothetical protein